MEGENFESTNVESYESSSESYNEGSSYEESGSYESSSYEESSHEDSSYEDSSNEGASQSNYESNYEEPISAKTEDGLSFELSTDPITGKTEFKVNTAEETAEKEEQQQYEQQQREQQQYNEEYARQLAEQQAYYQQLQQMQPPKYTLDEFSIALAANNVDESRIPDGLIPKYADYKINQAKEMYNQRVAEEQYKQQLIAQQMQIQASPEARIAANKNFYENLDTEATALAMNDLGLTPEALEDLEYAEDAEKEKIKSSLDSAKNWHKQQLMDQLQARYKNEQAYKAQQQQIYNEVTEFTANLAANEPHFAEIDSMLATAWQNMPTKYGTVVRKALSSLANGTITRQQCAVIQKYYEDTRRLYYAQMNGLGTRPQRRRPPVVERAGNGQASPTRQPDFKALRSADARGKKQWFDKFFANIEL